MKVGIIRCMQTEDYCPGSADFKVMREHTGAFGDAEGDIELVGFTNCGGCPGKKAVLMHSKGKSYWISVPICKENEGTDTKGSGRYCFLS